MQDVTTRFSRVGPGCQWFPSKTKQEATLEKSRAMLPQLSPSSNGDVLVVTLQPCFPVLYQTGRSGDIATSSGGSNAITFSVVAPVVHQLPFKSFFLSQLWNKLITTTFSSLSLRG